MKTLQLFLAFSALILSNAYANPGLERKLMKDLLNFYLESQLSVSASLQPSLEPGEKMVFNSIDFDRALNRDEIKKIFASSAKPNQMPVIQAGMSGSLVVVQNENIKYDDLYMAHSLQKTLNEGLGEEEGKLAWEKVKAKVSRGLPLIALLRELLKGETLEAVLVSHEEAKKEVEENAAAKKIPINESLDKFISYKAVKAFLYKTPDRVLTSLKLIKEEQNDELREFLFVLKK